MVVLFPVFKKDKIDFWVMKKKGNTFVIIKIQILCHFSAEHPKGFYRKVKKETPSNHFLPEIWDNLNYLIQ